MPSDKTEKTLRKTTYRLYPNAGQLSALETTRLLHQRVYNTLLEEHRRRFEAKERRYSFDAMCRDLTQWRSAVPALEALNAQSLQVTAKRVTEAFQAFFRRVKSGNTPGYPRFKAADRYPGWGYKKHGDGWRFIPGEKKRKATLRISGIGLVPLRGVGRFTGTPKTMELFKKGNRWYASVTFTVAKDQIARENTAKSGLAFDWGLKSLLTTVDSTGVVGTVDNPRHLKQRLDRLKALDQRIEAAKSGGSDAEWLKILTRRRAALHRLVGNQRKDFLHKLSAQLVQSHAAVVTEDLAVANMVRRPKAKKADDGTYAPNGAAAKSGLNRGILDAAPGMLLQFLEYKAEEAGIPFIKLDTRKVKPTQRCAACGAVAKKGLKDRVHRCACGHEDDRDANAARVMWRVYTEGAYWAVGPGTGQSRGNTRLQKPSH